MNETDNTVCLADKAVISGLRRSCPLQYPAHGLCYLCPSYLYDCCEHYETSMPSHSSKQADLHQVRWGHCDRRIIPPMLERDNGAPFTADDTGCRMSGCDIAHGVSNIADLTWIKVEGGRQQ